MQLLSAPLPSRKQDSDGPGTGLPWSSRGRFVVTLWADDGPPTVTRRDRHLRRRSPRLISSMRTRRETALCGRAKTSGAVWFLNQGLGCLVQTLCRLPPRTPGKRHYAVRLHPSVGCEPQAPRHIGEMRPLLLSGLLCVPAVVMLYFSWPHDRGGRLEDATVAPVPMAAVSAVIEITSTVSLPPRSQREPPQMDLDAWELWGPQSHS